MLTKKDLDRFWDLAQNLPVTTRNNHSYLSTMERNAGSNLIKRRFADDESVVSSIIGEDPGDQNQIQSQDELTNHNPFGCNIHFLSNMVATFRNYLSSFSWS